MLDVERFTLEVGGTRVVGVLHLPPGDGHPCVVACHGMGASKDSDKYLLLGEALPDAGLALARFDFRGGGESGGSYREATVAGRIADVDAVLARLAAHPRLDGRCGLLGSSLGGFVALWVAAVRARAPAAGAVPVVTWNAPADLRELGEHQVSPETGLGPALVEEVRAGVYAAAPAGVPHVMLVQGTADEVVPPSHADHLFERLHEPRALHLIRGANHRLSDPAHRREALAASLAWLRRWLPAGAVPRAPGTAPRVRVAPPA